MKFTEFSAKLNAAIDRLVNMYGEKNSPRNYILNLGGRHSIDKFDDLATRLFIDENYVYNSIEIGLTKKKDVNEVYVIVPGYPPKRYEKFAKNRFGLPIVILGREVKVKFD